MSVSVGSLALSEIRQPGPVFSSPMLVQIEVVRYPFSGQYLARYWFAVRAGKIGSPVMRFIILEPVKISGLEIFIYGGFVHSN
jgi:hypothetical protein